MLVTGRGEKPRGGRSDGALAKIVACYGRTSMPESNGNADSCWTGNGAQQGLITTIYLSEGEFRVLSQLPGKMLSKVR